jgi:hypothetical protein
VSDTAIQHWLVKGVEFYTINFYNSKHQLIKENRKLPNDNHKVKWEDRYDHYKTYYIYNGDILEKKIIFNFKTKSLSKVHFVYGNFNKKKEVEYFDNKDLPKDCLQELIDGDYYLNYPEKLPTTDWVLTGKEERTYLYDTLLAAIKIYSYNDKKLLLNTIDSCVYNEKKQLIEYLSLMPIDGYGNIMQTFDYDCNDGKLIKRNDYVDGQYQAENTFNYTDTLIVEKIRFFNYYDKNNPYSYNKSTWVYKKDEKTGKFYCKQLDAEFKLPNEIE